MVCNKCRLGWKVQKSINLYVQWIEDISTYFLCSQFLLIINLHCVTTIFVFCFCVCNNIPNSFHPKFKIHIMCDQMRNCSKTYCLTSGKILLFFKSGYKMKCLGLSMDPRNKWRNQWQQTNICRIMTIKIPSPTRLVEQGIM